MLENAKIRLGQMDLVLHCSIASSLKSIDSYMGAYTPYKSKECGGMPIWKRKESLSKIISSRAKKVAGEGLVFHNSPSDAPCYLTICNSKWIVTRGVLPDTESYDSQYVLKSARPPGPSELRLALENWEEPDYFKSRDPLFMVTTNCNFSPWVLRTNTTDKETAVSVVVTPAIFVKQMLNILDSDVREKPESNNKKKITYANHPLKKATEEWIGVKKHSKKGASEYPPSKELWNRDVIIDIGIIPKNEKNYHSKLAPIVNRLSSVYAPVPGTKKGDFPIWKKKSALHEDLYLFVEENKFWCISSFYPDEHAKSKNKNGVILESKSDTSKSDTELAKLAYDRENGKSTDLTIGQRPIISSKWSLLVNDLSEEVEVWIAPFTLWDPATASSCLTASNYSVDKPQSTNNGVISEAAASKVPKCSEEFALQACSRVCSDLKLNFPGTKSTFNAKWKGQFVTKFSLEELLECLFDKGEAPCNWLQVNDSVTSPIIKAIFDRRKDFGLHDRIFDSMLDKISAEKRIKDMTVLVGSDVAVTAQLLCDVFQDLPKGTNNQFANKLALETKTVVLKSKADKARVLEISKDKLGKGPRSSLSAALKKGEVALLKASKVAKTGSAVLQDYELDVAQEMDGIMDFSSDESLDHRKSLEVPSKLAVYHNKIDELLKWYEQELIDCKDLNSGDTEANIDDAASDTSDEEEEDLDENGQSSSDPSLLTPEQIFCEIDKCAVLPEKERDKILDSVEKRINLKTWDVDSVELPVLITEQAHKWFQRRAKKHKPLCLRVIRRLRLLATGRRTYVLCKPLTTNNPKIKLWESKIDAARRIIWEEAFSFSPRRSTEGNFFAESGIRVWDIVEDHDNLTRAIRLTAERIEKSHTRGMHCGLYTELMNAGDLEANGMDTQLDSITPKCYPMREGIRYTSDGPVDNSVHRLNHPANDDEKQYNLLKFYELNYHLVQVILDKEGEVEADSMLRCC